MLLAVMGGLPMGRACLLGRSGGLGRCLFWDRTLGSWDCIMMSSCLSADFFQGGILRACARFGGGRGRGPLWMVSLGHDEIGS
jgi:hypothetical protein